METVTIIIIVLVSLIILLEILKKIETKRIQNKLYQYMTNNEIEKFEKLASGTLTKYLIHPFNTNFMRLNIALVKNDKKEIEKLLKIFEVMKMNDSQKESVYSKLFQYYLTQQNKKDAKKYYKKLKELKDFNSKDELDRIYDIYLNDGHKYLKEFLKAYKNASNEQKILILPHIIKMYDNQGDKKSADEYTNILKELIEKEK